jgi:DNA (cytosine-5)-methyltransferase 3A
MKKEYQDVITEHLGVEPIMINSALVSAQNRVRLYWTNIPNITQPEDRDIVLKDILENGIATDEMTTSDKKSFCLTARYQGAVAWNSIEKRQRTMVQVGMANDINGHDILKRIYSSEGKAPTLNSMNGGNRQPKIACGALRGRQITPGSKEYTQMLELREDNKTNTLTSVQKDNVLTQDKMYYRKLTPLECERLQTVPDGYTEGVSNTQRYKMLGNGWTVEVIKHVLQNIT